MERKIVCGRFAEKKGTTGVLCNLIGKAEEKIGVNAMTKGLG